MTRDENMPWCWLLLGILNDAGGTTILQDIYDSIERDSAASAQSSPKIVRPGLFSVNPKYGERPIYQHTVRGCLAFYRKQGLVDRVGRGVYRITDKGLNRLGWYNKQY